MISTAAITSLAFPGFVFFLTPLLLQALDIVAPQRRMQAIGERFVKIIESNQFHYISEVTVPMRGQLQLDQGRESENPDVMNDFTPGIGSGYAIGPGLPDPGNDPVTRISMVTLVRPIFELPLTAWLQLIVFRDKGVV